MGATSGLVKSSGSFNYISQRQLKSYRIVAISCDIFYENKGDVVEESVGIVTLVHLVSGDGPDLLFSAVRSQTMLTGHNAHGGHIHSASRITNKSRLKKYVSLHYFIFLRNISIISIICNTQRRSERR